MPGHDFTVAWNANGVLTLTGREYVDATVFGDTHRTYLVGTGQPEDEMVNWRGAFNRMKNRPKYDKEQMALHREAVFSLFNKINKMFETLAPDAQAAGIPDAKSTAELISRLQIEMQFIERREAEEKAEWLLDQHLNDQQRETFARKGWIQIAGKDANTYRVNKEAMTSVWVKGPKGHWTKRGDFCMYPSDHTLPMADKILATKLYLEANEAGYLKDANFSDMEGHSFRKLLPDGKLKPLPKNRANRYGIGGQFLAQADWLTFDEPVRMRLGDFNNNTTETADEEIPF